MNRLSVGMGAWVSNPCGFARMSALFTGFAAAMFCASVVTGSAYGQCVPEVFPDRWLQGQEALGGHTIARHVGKTDKWLMNRLQKSSRISAASSYHNAETATTYIQAALTAKARMLNRWVRDVPVGATRAVDDDAKVGVGRVAFRPPRSTNILTSTTLRAVMRTMADGTCFLLTSYPIR